MIRLLFYFKKFILRFLYNTHISNNSQIEGSFFDSLVKSKLHISKSKVKLGNGVKIINCNIKLIKGELIIGDNVVLENVEITNRGVIIISDLAKINDYKIISDTDTKLSIGKKTVLEKGDNWRKPQILISSSSNLTINDYNRIRCDFELRFGGYCEIGEYNCINEQTEIRTDEYISIGSYNMISYRCRIWDTNTHTFYKDGKRRQLTRQFYPNIGVEIDKPQTKVVSIGDDNLVGEGTLILKGTKIHNHSIIGTNAVVCSLEVPNNCKVVGNPGIIK